MFGYSKRGVLVILAEFFFFFCPFIVTCVGHKFHKSVCWVVHQLKLTHCTVEVSFGIKRGRC